MGEQVNFWLTVTHLGRTSVRFLMGVSKDGVDRVRTHRVAVCVSQKSHKAVPIPQEVREKIQAFMIA